MRPQNASMPNHLLQNTHAVPHMTHIGTPQAHLATQNVYPLSGSEHLKPSPSLSQNTASQASTSEKHVVPHQSTHTSTTMLPSHTSQLHVHHGTACIVDKPIGSITLSSSHSELPREGGAPTFLFTATKSQDGSPSRQEQKQIHPNIKEEVAEASTKHTTQVAVDPTDLSTQKGHMKPMSEYMIKGSFQLRAVSTKAKDQGFYEDDQGGQFKLLSPFQGQKLQAKSLQVPTYEDAHICIQRYRRQ